MSTEPLYTRMFRKHGREVCRKAWQLSNMDGLADRYAAQKLFPETFGCQTVNSFRKMVAAYDQWLELSQGAAACGVAA